MPKKIAPVSAADLLAVHGITDNLLKRVADLESDMLDALANSSGVESLDQIADDVGLIPMGGLLFTDVLYLTTTSIVVQNTVVETTILSTTIPGGSLGTDRMVRAEIFGRLANDTGSGKTIRLKVKLGGVAGLTTYIDMTSASIATDPTDIRPVLLEIILCGDGALNAQKLLLNGSIGHPGTIGGDMRLGGKAGSPSEDSTENLTLEVSIALSAADLNFWFIREAAIGYNPYRPTE